MARLAEPICVVGLGLSGRAALRLLRLRTYTKVKIYDDKDSQADLRGADSALAYAPKTLVVSPGVNLKTPWIETLKKAGSHITSELALASAELDHEKVVGITGSLGKSTTTSLIGVGLSEIGTVFVGGNIGNPLANYVSDVIEGKRKRAQFVVLELSSYQLENAGPLRVDIAALTSLNPNHLDRYADLVHYYDTKLNLFKMGRGPLDLEVVVNARGGDAAAWLQKRSDPGLRVHLVSGLSGELAPEKFARSKLVGAHNHDNLAVAYKVVSVLGGGDKSLAAMLNYAGLAHRVQALGNLKGIDFVNDSKATTMESVLTAVTSCWESFKPRHLWVLLGGRDKKLPWTELSFLKKWPDVRPIYFGECGELARAQSELNGDFCPKLAGAIERAKTLATSGDLILLSPGGTSLDEFKNFEERGNFFISKVFELWG